MAGHVQCQCGSLAKWATDPTVPYGCDPVPGRYFLKLSDTVIVADGYCVLCGGHVGFPKGLPFCQCGFLAKCEKDPALPIEEENNGFALRRLPPSQDSWIAIWYCPACGGTA